MTGGLFSRRVRILVCLGAALAVSAIVSATALGADSVYWSNNGANKISRASLDGSGGSDISTAGAPALVEPNGVAIDAATGRIYWIDESGHIGYANLDGSGGGGELNTAGTLVSGPRGLAIDPQLGRLYWVNQGAPAGKVVAYANLDGTGGGFLDTTGATAELGADGLAIDPAANRIYWGEQEHNKIGYANLDGSGGGGDLNTTGATINGPSGLAIDAATNTLYVTEFYSDSVSYIHLNGSGGGHLEISPLSNPEDPYGIALDPPAGRLYFAGWEAPQAIYSASLGGGGGGTLNTSGATATGKWSYPAILVHPEAAGAPTISGGSQFGSTLTCGKGSWAPDLVEANFFRVPQSTSFQWTRDGADIAGATSATVVASASGEYRCRETATNAAGSASQTSAPLKVEAPSNAFEIGGAKLNKAKGTALLSVTLPGPGILTLSSKQVVSGRVNSGGGNVKLLVKARGKAAKALAKKGRAKVKFQLGFTPTGGTLATQSKSLTLVKQRRHRH